MSVSNEDHAATSIAILENRSNLLDPSDQFHKMNVYCWEKIFDYFALQDIITMSKTCMRMHRICGYYLRENFPEVQCKWIKNDGLYVGYSTCVKGDNLSEYVNNVTIIDDLDRFLKAEDYRSLRILLLRNIHPDGTIVNHIKEVLKYVEDIDFRGCFSSENLHKKILKHCTRLKRLTINEHTFGMGRDVNSNEHNFFGQSYPTLERFDYIFCLRYYPPRGQLCYFLERNTNLKHFSIDMGTMWETRDSFIKLNGSTRAVTICVEEDVYLATKMQNIYSDLSLVKIARGESETLGSLDTYCTEPKLPYTGHKLPL